jgi:hypothetical protein
MKKNKIVPFSNENDSQSRQKIITKQANKSNNSLQEFNNNELPFGGMKFVYVQKPLDELANCTGVIIKQEPDLEEGKYGYEKANRYHVFGIYGQDYKYLFNCKERSGCCMRNCCPSASRQFNMEISHISSSKKKASDYIFANVFKPLSCKCFCCCRAEIILRLNEGTKKKGIQQINVGSVKEGFSLCDPKFEIYDGTNQLKYIVTANCCQCGLLCCNWCMGKVYEVIFDIINPVDNQIIGNIIRKEAEGDELVTDADSYEIIFPINANAIDKLLIVVLGLMIDYQYFEVTYIHKKRKRRPANFVFL